MFDDFINAINEAIENNRTISMSISVKDGNSSYWVITPEGVEVAEKTVYIYQGDSYYNIEANEISYDEVLDQYLLKSDYSVAAFIF